MKQLVFFIFILFLGATPLLGQHLDKIPTEANSVLWKIEGKKVKKDSYIFGTIHLIPKELYDFPVALKTLIEESEQVVLEVAELDPTAALPHLILKEGTLFDFFTPEQNDSILIWVKETVNMEPEHFKMSFSKMKPFVLMQLATQKNIAQSESFDLNIMKLATEKNISLLGLETIGEQIAIFDAIDTLEIQNLVMDGIRNPEKMDEKMEKLYQKYLEKNVDHLLTYTQQEEGGLSDFTDQLLDNRNQNWIPIIEQLIKKKKTFIAVGAAHLGGENGVLRLLEKQGYTLTPIQL